MFFRGFFLLGLLIATASANHEVSEESSFELPSDWANIRSNIDTSFSCVGRAYGYYADVANDCQLYHVCQPRIENEQVQYTHNPFICPLETVFDQKALTCVHSTPEFSCADSERHYPESSPVEHSVVSNSVELAPPERSVIEPVVEITHDVVPPVNEHVVHHPIVSPVESVAPVNEPVTSEVVEERSPISVPVVENSSVVAEVVTPAVVENRIVPVPVDAPIVPAVESEVPVSSEAAPSSNVSLAHSEVPNVEVVSSAVGTLRHLPVYSTKSRQNQEPIKMEQPVKGPTKSVYVTKRQIETPVKAPAPVKSVQQVIAPIAQPAKTVQQNVQPVKSVQQKIQPAKSVQQNVHPIEQPAKTVQQKIQPVKSVQQNVHPIEQPAKTVQAVKSVQQNVHPIEQPAKTVQQKIQPAKSVQQNVHPIDQPAKSVVEQQPVKQQVEIVAKSPAPVKSYAAQQVVKSIRHQPIVKQVQQTVEVPRKSYGLVKQELVRTPYTVLYNGQPTWRHHYYKLYPHLIRNNPYHVRTTVHRWV